MKSAVVIKIFPEESAQGDGFPALQSVRHMLADRAKKKQLTTLLVSHGAQALVVMPEYNQARANDTGKELIFHVYTGKTPVDALDLAQLGCAIEDILGLPGVILPFDRDHILNVKQYFPAQDAKKDPFQAVFLELNNHATHKKQGAHNAGPV